MRKRSMAMILAALAPAAAAQAQPPRPELRRLCGAGAVYRKGDLPPEALSALKLAMADPDEPFQAGDVIGPGPRLPSRRLICAEPTSDGWTVRYEFGGRGYGTSAVDLTRLADGGFVQGPSSRNPARPAG